ncbi:sulfatase-like hydrolase/transferase [Trinickia dinghuensis]|uniref:DUF4976 domain-containing protein n=1 Tax=Trinickia dinghuensis TaxID=2291023 RepID=A0A3D8JWQ9_9BURK|nr:sulfatase-like hydrolase/transferase [Trinickia dinghuensis]RDU97232.1 DUF4976 domain-containing protein [Trinickia dinghuensis]
MSKPNVLMITVDHWPGKLLGIAGHPVVQTPTLDDLARAGVRFPNATTECPICIPARRSLMLGTSPRGHGDRVYNERSPMPTGTLAETFSAAGYQTFAVGKLHVFPQRNRIGFDDVLLDEEGRAQYGVTDDYELFLGDQGYVGQQFDHGMCTDGYVHRPWHLPERLHVTNWATQGMIRQIKRRDPTRPNFWYLSYRHPHPPLVPLQCYLDMYRDVEMDPPFAGDWYDEELPWMVASKRKRNEKHSAMQIANIRRAFYALCTHIDHQLRCVIGTLREERLLDDTIILFTADHGDTLGDHGLWAKASFYEGSCNVPMILVPTRGDTSIGAGVADDRLVTLSDVMPTLLGMTGIPVPSTCNGLSMVEEARRSTLYAEYGTDDTASRMIRNERYKLIYYPVGNTFQLFDLKKDPKELQNLAHSAEHEDIRAELTARLSSELYGDDVEWLRDGKFVGFPNRPANPRINRDLSSQRGHHWPPQPASDLTQALYSV